MTIAFVLGNGQSRRGVDLEKLKVLGPVYGCNSLYTEFEPYKLVATDRPIAQRIQESGYSAKHKFYTRRPLPGLGAIQVPKKYHGNSSGPIATALAAMDGHHRIYMLGFDMGPTQNQRFNNIYAGTEFYKSPDAMPTYTGNWIKQLQIVCQDFKRLEFVRVYGETTAEIVELRAISNMKHLQMHEFLNRIDTNENLF